MKHIKIILFALCLSLTPVFCSIAQTTDDGIIEKREALVIPISETIDFGLKEFIKRAINAHRDVKFVVLDIETYGGHLEAALDISEILTTLDSDITTIAYVRGKALSAGALIALSCNEIVMRKDSTIGDCAPVSACSDGQCNQIMGEKIQSPLRAVFRKIAVKNGYPEKPAQAMVTKELGIFLVTYDDGKKEFLTKSELDAFTTEQLDRIKEQKIIVEPGQLLTLHSQEAFDLGFARHIANDIVDLKTLYSIDNFVHATQNWDETLVRLIISISPILMTLGILGIWIEIRTPGFGFPGLIGIVCIGLVIAGKYMIGLSSYTEILIFITGFILLGLEIFVIPGFGITGIAGIILIIIGFYLMSVPFVIPETSWEFDTLYSTLREFAISLAFAVAGGAALAYFVPKTKWGRRRIFLDRSENAEDGFVASDPATIKVGQKATAATALRPAGKIRFEDKLFDAIAEGEFIENNSQVEVVKTEGSKIIVRSV